MIKWNIHGSVQLEVLSRAVHQPVVWMQRRSPSPLVDDEMNRWAWQSSAAVLGFFGPREPRYAGFFCEEVWDTRHCLTDAGYFSGILGSPEGPCGASRTL